MKTHELITAIENAQMLLFLGEMKLYKTYLYFREEAKVDLQNMGVLFALNGFGDTTMVRLLKKHALMIEAFNIAKTERTAQLTGKERKKFLAKTIRLVPAEDVFPEREKCRHLFAGFADFYVAKPIEEVIAALEEAFQ